MQGKGRNSYRNKRKFVFEMIVLLEDRYGKEKIQSR